MGVGKVDRKSDPGLKVKGAPHYLVAVTPGKRKGKVFEDQLKIIAWSALTLGARLWICKALLPVCDPF